jgi:hypothetical protein
MVSNIHGLSTGKSQQENLPIESAGRVGLPGFFRLTGQFFIDIVFFPLL